MRVVVVVSVGGRCGIFAPRAPAPAKQPAAEDDDQQAGGELQPGEQAGGQNVLGEDQGDHAKREHGSGVRERDDGAQEDGVLHRAARAHEVRGYDALAVARRKGVQGPQHDRRGKRNQVEGGGQVGPAYEAGEHGGRARVGLWSRGGGLRGHLLGIGKPDDLRDRLEGGRAAVPVFLEVLLGRLWGGCVCRSASREHEVKLKPSVLLLRRVERNALHAAHAEPVQTGDFLPPVVHGEVARGSVGGPVARQSGANHLVAQSEAVESAGPFDGPESQRRRRHTVESNGEVGNARRDPRARLLGADGVVPIGVGEGPYLLCQQVSGGECPHEVDAVRCQLDDLRLGVHVGRVGPGRGRVKPGEKERQSDGRMMSQRSLAHPATAPETPAGCRRSRASRMCPANPP